MEADDIFHGVGNTNELNKELQSKLLTMRELDQTAVYPPAENLYPIFVEYYQNL